MMAPLLALALLRPQGEGVGFRETTFDGLIGPKTMMIRTRAERLEPPKRSPKQGWEFDWTTAGYANNGQEWGLRFDLYSQESTAGSARPASVVRTLLRLFAYNIMALRLDHADEFHQIVSVYLCYGGEPGGEQLFDVDKGLDGNKVNTIYLYDLKSLTDPVETVREVAHEYGHATLPPVGGFTAPEDWANGVLGEKLYLDYLARARKAGQLGPEDTFGATPEALSAWVRKNVDPLVEDAALKGPRAWGKDKAGMDAFLGLALWTARLNGPKAMARALTFSKDPQAFAANAATVAEETRTTPINLPPSLVGKAIWVPLGKGKVSNADVLGRKDGWVHIRPERGKRSVVTQAIALDR